MRSHPFRKSYFWEEQKTLFVADPHFGKATVFRKAGIPVTETTQDDLNKLSEIMSQRFQANYFPWRFSACQTIQNASTTKLALFR